MSASLEHQNADAEKKTPPTPKRNRLDKATPKCEPPKKKRYSHRSEQRLLFHSCTRHAVKLFRNFHPASIRNRGICAPHKCNAKRRHSARVQNLHYAAHVARPHTATLGVLRYRTPWWLDHRPRLQKYTAEAGKLTSYLRGSLGAQGSLFTQLFLDVIAKDSQRQRGLIGSCFHHLSKHSTTNGQATLCPQLRGSPDNTAPRSLGRDLSLQQDRLYSQHAVLPSCLCRVRHNQVQSDLVDSPIFSRKLSVTIAT